MSDFCCVVRAAGLRLAMAGGYAAAMNEMLDIVNEHDEVVGQATREDCHRLNHLHRAIHIVLTNSRQDIFVQLRSHRKDTNPGLWDSSAAGHVDAGESYIDCAVRELHEELGIRIAAEGLLQIGQLPPSIENGYEFVRIYTACSDETITLEAGEIDDGKWLSHDEIQDWMLERPEEFASSFVEIWHAFSRWRSAQ